MAIVKCAWCRKNYPQNLKGGKVSLCCTKECETRLEAKLQKEEKREMSFKNSPRVNGGTDGPGKVRRYVHAPISIDHFGIHASISEHGRVTISKVARTVGEEIEYDEVEVPASLINKLSLLLHATRSVVFVDPDEAQGEGL